MLIDSHCHLDFPELTSDESGVLARALQRRVLLAGLHAGAQRVGLQRVGAGLLLRQLRGQLPA